jgi:hypothetical protein
MLYFKIPHHATLRFAVRNSERGYCKNKRAIEKSHTFWNTTPALTLSCGVTLNPKAASQQRLGFFILKNPSKAQVCGRKAHADAAQ